MTREQVKKLLPIMQAYAEGKTIQFLYEGEWADIYETDFSQSPDVYRIKPEPKYRPFKNQEECWNEMLKYKPFGWICVNSKYYQILGVVDSGVRFANEFFTFNEAIDYTFLDGTPFGIKE